MEFVAQASRLINVDSFARRPDPAANDRLLKNQLLILSPNSRSFRPAVVFYFLRESCSLIPLEQWSELGGSETE